MWVARDRKSFGEKTLLISCKVRKEKKGTFMEVKVNSSLRYTEYGGNGV